MFGIFKKSARRAKRRSNGVTYGALEEKRLLAGDVVVNNADHLFIRGDNADNQIEIIGNDDGSISIIGKNGTTINRSSEPLVISGSQAGDDASIYGGIVASFENGLRAHMGGGNDKIFVQGIEFNDSSIVYGGTGDDSVGAYRSTFDRLLVQTFTGDDSISLEETTARGDLYLRGLAGEDTIGVTYSQLMKSVFTSGGNENDRLAFYDVKTQDKDGQVFVLGQGGDDYIQVKDLLNDGSLGVYGGDGDDRVHLTVGDPYATSDPFPDPEGEDENFSVLGDIRVGGQGGTDNYIYSGFIRPVIPVQVGTFETGEALEADQLKEIQIDSDLIGSGARLGTAAEWLNANTDYKFETLWSAIASTGLTTLSNNPGSLTLFAPTDAAFAKLPEGTLEGLSTDQLSNILKFHFADDPIDASNLVTLDSVDTLFEDESFSVSVDDDGVKLNGDATLAFTDVRTKTGFVHVLNEVLIPQA